MQCQCVLSSSTWVFIPCRDPFILHLAASEVFWLGLLCVAAAQGAHGRQRFSVPIRLEKTQEKLSRTSNDGNEQKLVLCDGELKESQLPALLAGGDRERAASPVLVWAAPEWVLRVQGDGRGEPATPGMKDLGQWVPRSALPLPSRAGATRSRQVTRKSISGGDVGAGTNSPPDYLPTLPLIT